MCTIVTLFPEVSLPLSGGWRLTDKVWEFPSFFLEGKIESGQGLLKVLVRGGSGSFWTPAVTDKCTAVKRYLFKTKTFPPSHLIVCVTRLSGYTLANLDSLFTVGIVFVLLAIPKCNYALYL